MTLLVFLIGVLVVWFLGLFFFGETPEEVISWTLVLGAVSLVAWFV